MRTRKLAEHSRLGMYCCPDLSAANKRSFILCNPNSLRFISQSTYKILPPNHIPYDWKPLDPGSLFVVNMVIMLIIVKLLAIIMITIHQIKVLLRQYLKPLASMTVNNKDKSARPKYLHLQTYPLILLNNNNQFQREQSSLTFSGA